MADNGIRIPCTNHLLAVRQLFAYADSTGVTAQQLADRSGHSVRTIYAIRHAKKYQRNVSFTTFVDMARALGGDVVFTRTPRSEK